MKRILIPLLALALCAAAFPLLFASAQDGGPRRQDPRPEKSLDQLVRRHERLKLDPAAAARRVRSGGGLTLATPGHRFELELTPNDMRAPDYRAEATDEYGVRSALESAPVRTYKGVVRGQSKALARFTVDDETLEGMILTPEERYYVEPLGKYEPGAAATDFVLYKKSDIIEDPDEKCGVTMDGEVGDALKGVISQLAVTTPEPSAVVGMMYEVEIATEADYAYFMKLGSSAAAANAEIMSTMNQVDGVYEAELNISLKVVYQHVWTGAGNTYPYGTSAGDKLLERFTDYWNANFAGVHRDLAHLWTGQNIVDPYNDPNLIGIAAPGTICAAPQFAYALSERMTTAASRAILAAHEIGHNFGATHQCSGTIMNSFLSGSTLTFCPSSRSQIGVFLDINSSCLTQSCSPAVSPAALSFPEAGGAGSVSVATIASCAWTAKSNVPWIVVNSGASGSGNKTVAYTVAASPDPVARTGTLTIAGKTHTVTQAPATLLKSLTLKPTSVAGGNKITVSLSITQAAPAAGAVIALTDNLAAVTVPPTVTIPAGGKSKTFTLTTAAATAVQTGAVMASYNGSTLSAALTVRPAALTSLTLTAAAVTEGSSVTAKLTLDGAAPAGGAVVTLSDTLTSADTPASVTIPSGASSKTFVIPTRAVTATQTGSVKAVYAGVTMSAPLTVRLVEVAGLLLTPEEVVGGNAAQGVVVLEAKAPKNISVTLAENVASASVPPTVVVPAGSKTAAFALTTTAVASQETGVLIAAAQGSSKGRGLVVNRTPVVCSTLSFEAPKTFSSLGSVTAMLTADLTGDGKLDIAALVNSQVSIYPGTGAGDFGAPVVFALAEGGDDLALGDFNQDGYNDLAVAASTKLAILSADGSGSFRAPAYFLFPEWTSTNRSIAVGDINGDGRADVAATNSGAGNLVVMLGDGRGGFGTPTRYNFNPANADDIAMGDFNGDGKSDLVKGSYRETYAYVILGIAAGLGTPPHPIELKTSTLPSFVPYEVAVGDFNRDGKQDLAFSTYLATAVVLGDGAGGFRPPVVYKGPGYSYELLVKDMNGDGKEDLITLNHAPTVSVLLGNGAGRFAAPFTTGSPGSAPDVVAGDFNGDTRPDLAYTVNGPSSQIAVQLSTCK